MKSINFSSKKVQVATLSFLALIWGSSFILMHRGLDSFQADEVAAYRLFIVFVALIPFVKKDIHLLLEKRGLALLSVGLFGSALPYFLFVKAQTQIDSSLSGILNSLTPMFTLLFALVFFNQKFKRNSIIGVFLGFVGAAGLIYFSESQPTWESFSLYVFMPIVASACYGLNVNIIKMYLQNVSPMSMTALAFLWVGPFAGVYLFFFTDFVPHLVENPKGWESLGYISILGVVGTALAVWIFNMLIKETSALFASSVTYLIPIVAIAWGLVDGDQMNGFQFLFVGVILFGVAIINSKRKVNR